MSTVVSLPQHAAKCLTPRTIRIDGDRVTIKANDESDSFQLAELPISNRPGETPARGFRCVRPAGKAVTTVIAVDGSTNDACDCDSFAWRANCLHCAGLRALLSRNLLNRVPCC